MLVLRQDFAAYGPRLYAAENDLFAVHWYIATYEDENEIAPDCENLAPSTMKEANGICNEHIDPSLTTIIEVGATEKAHIASRLPYLYGWPTINDEGHKIIEQSSGAYRPLKIIGVGAGASGINLAKFAQDQLKNVQLIVYEKNADVAGTWLENRYPGAACDIPSVTYQYSWEPAIWSKYYSEAPEIFSYFKSVVEKYDLLQHIRLKHRVDHAEWLEDQAQWRIKISNLETEEQIEDHCDIFVNAMGFLNDWRWPKIEGRELFQGVAAHSAAYPDGLSLQGKKVAVVGNGSSGVQIVANIHKDVSELFTWIRTPTWMTAGFAQRYAGPKGENFEYTEAQKERLRRDPDFYLQYRKAVEAEMNGGFMAFHKNTPESKGALQFAEQEMRTRLRGHERLADALIPKTFPVGCKRPTPGNGYLEALVQPNVVTYKEGGLEKITARGFVSPDGHEQDVDVIIFATGFNTSWVPRFPIIAHGTNLQDIYRERPVGYIGVAAPQMPNYFTFYGPYGPLGQGSAMPMIELFAKYIIQMVQKMQLEHIRKVTPKQGAIDAYAEHADLFNKRTVYDSPCRSWFKGGTYDGRIMLHPGTRAQYLEMLAQPRYEDYDIEYCARNMWSWLGNGFSERDLDGRDGTWYMGLVDGIDKQRDYDVDEMLYSA